MQPMLHVQLMRNLVDCGLDPQEAVDAPRWFLCGTGSSQAGRDMRFSHLQLEEGYGSLYDGGPAAAGEEAEAREEVRATEEVEEQIPEAATVKALRLLGHNIERAAAISSSSTGGGGSAGVQGVQVSQLSIGASVGSSGGGVLRGKDRHMFGWAHVVLRDPASGVAWAGADPRCDGCAVPALPFSFSAL
jgi:hypothetical protein